MTFARNEKIEPGVATEKASNETNQEDESELSNSSDSESEYDSEEEQSDEYTDDEDSSELIDHSEEKPAPLQSLNINPNTFFKLPTYEQAVLEKAAYEQAKRQRLIELEMERRKEEASQEDKSVECMLWSSAYF